MQCKMTDIVDRKHMPRLMNRLAHTPKPRRLWILAAKEIQRLRKELEQTDYDPPKEDRKTKVVKETSDV